MEGCPGGKGGRAHRVTGACRCGEDSIPGVDPDIGPRVAALRTGAMRLLPTLRQACTRPADHKEPSVSVAPSLTAVTGPPLPPPEPLPDVSTATPCRPASGGLTFPCPTCGRVHFSVHSMRAHAGSAQPGVIIVCEGLPCGCHNGAAVFLTGASRAGRHRSCQACQQARHAGSTNASTRDGPGSSATASSRTPRAADPRRTTGDSASSTAGMPSSLGTGTATVCDCPSPHDGILATFVRTVLALLTRYCSSIQPNKITSCFVVNIGCNSRGPTVRVVCGDLLFVLLLCCCVAVCAAPSCVCAHPP
ncbi:mucin TcMUC [Trypanosoma cruzi]|uniref:Uncharacterized protein n=1 Tax=Trypanosoma cruzi (strain CL Brener) TaxID=353153 RepID=Q4CZB1_TRYCC|nr:hypothetical protein Tc00.1047053508359.70 [Trypanosoma cruzi]EAN85613.1 hypothetical protein Tc00.1047053508359.70 [Trypanosoma cruzi]RNC33534.1 mucin TcMUC [Trypanosoma cruzi]|eukprot:XP_807464.1 hypothetical protein [Trypanosoma cruzi strain CL Brener]